MNFLQLSQDAWRDFFDDMTTSVRGRLVEIDVLGLDLGELVEAEWLWLVGITYEPNEDALYVFVDTAGGGVDHAIVHPKRVFVELGPSGMSQVVVFDAEEHRQFLRLRPPLELPSGASAPAP
jgi:hypothetical protein